MAETTPANSGSTDTRSTPFIRSASASPKDPGRSGSVRGPGLHPRSCVTCRRRKVRCDKKNPCLNCTKAGIDCIFPGPGRAPRKARKPPDAELLARLKKLEGVVQSLGAQVDEDEGISEERNAAPNLHAESANHFRKIARQTSVADGKSPTLVDNQLGRLVISEGRSRYVSNAFWASMGEELSEMRDILDEPSSENDDIPSPENSVPGSTSTSHQGFLLGYSSLTNNLRSLHPTPSQLFVLWSVFEENVDPLVRIYHRPSARKVIMKASTGPENLSKSAEVLLFSMYYAAVGSLTPAQCVSLLGEDKEHSLNRYRFAVEQALARANFLSSSSLMVLQGFVLFLICVRNQDDTRMVFSLSGLALHLAMALGIHRDGANFGLSPFETEMRRRLWCQICFLDSRAAEDHGIDLTFSEQFYDSKIPLNINDEDISPESKEAPKERQGTTEMTFVLVRYELNIVNRRITFATPGKLACGFVRQLPTMEEKEKIIEETHKRLGEKYFQYCDMSVPIFWVSSTVGRLILAKMWLMAHHPMQYQTGEDEDGILQEVRDRLYATSVEVIEFSFLLEHNENTAKWGWLFRTYMQWHAVTFVLAELCVRPPGPSYERAWKAVESVYDQRRLKDPKSYKGMLWKPMRQLMAKAQAVRTKHYREGYTALSKAADAEDEMTERAWVVPTGQATTGQQMRPLFIPQGAIESSIEAFGLDIPVCNVAAAVNASMRTPTQSAMPAQMTMQSGLAAEPSFASDEIDQWLADDQMTQQNPVPLNWAGWSLGTMNIGDVPMGNNSIGQFAPASGVEEWF